MSYSVQPHRWQPTRLHSLWDSPGKNTGVVCHSFSNAWKWKVKVKLLSRVRLFVTPLTAAYQAPPSMGFSRQEYWNGVPLPSPTCNAGDSFSIPDQGNPIDRGAWQPTVHGVAKSSDTIWQPNNKETMIEENKFFFLWWIRFNVIKLMP